MLATSPTPSVAPAGAPVQVPDLGLSIYRSLVAELQALYPDNRERIGRALDVLLGADLYETAECGVYLVQSCKNAGIYYRASGLHCTCPDHSRQSDRQCKHSAAVQLLCAASGQASWNRRQAGEPNHPRPATAVYCRSCGQEAEVDTTGVCDLCAWSDAIQVFTLTPAGLAYLDRCDATRVAVGV